MSAKYFQKNFFKIGLFYQLDSNNPIYLDKTGELIAKTDKFLSDWNGNIDGYTFKVNGKEIAGKVTMKHYWYNHEKQEDFDEQTILDFAKSIQSLNLKINEVYNPLFFTRIGFRMQLLFKKNNDVFINNYNAIMKNLFSHISTDAQIKTSNISFEIEKPDFNIRVTTQYVIKQPSNIANVPEKGFLFDLDFYKTLNNEILTETTKINEQFLANVVSTYPSIITKLTEVLGDTPNV